MPCPRRTCGHLELMHDWDESGGEPICCADDCYCGKDLMSSVINRPEVAATPGAVRNESKQTSEVNQ